MRRDWQTKMGGTDAAEKARERSSICVSIRPALVSEPAVFLSRGFLCFVAGINRLSIRSPANCRRFCITAQAPSESQHSKLFINIAESVFESDFVQVERLQKKEQELSDGLLALPEQIEQLQEKLRLKEAAVFRLLDHISRSLVAQEARERQTLGFFFFFFSGEICFRGNRNPSL